MNFDFIHTKQDLNQFLGAIEEYQAAFFKKESGSPEKYFSLEQIAVIKSYKDKLAMLQEDLKKLPVIYLKLSFNATVRQLEGLNSWFKKNFAKTVILDVVIDRDILGGVVIQSEGKIWDYSLSKYRRKL